MKTRQLTIIGFGFLAISGISLNFDYYQRTIVPVDATIGYFDDVISSAETKTIQTYLAKINHNLSQITEKLPHTSDINGEIISKNPVWFYGTESTNFLRIQSDVDAMMSSVDKMSAVPKDSSAYHTGMMDIHARSDLLRENLLDAKSFMYASATNIFFTLIWISGLAGIVRIWIKNEN